MNKKVIFAWPPMADPKGYATVGQNRQFQWFKDPTFIYPIVAAQCATMLLNDKNLILWVDSLAEEMNEVEFGNNLVSNPADYIIFESPTPTINRYLDIIKGIKTHMPNIKIILCGDHVTSDAGYEQLKDEKSIDHIVRGGKWHYEVCGIINGEQWPLNKKLPHINRDITRWWLYAYRNGNYKYIPATYIMSAMDCWHRPGCTFCSWAEYHPEYSVRPVEDVLDEIAELAAMGFKEIFDDSGTFPIGEWMDAFCEGMVSRGLDKLVSIGCNMRFGALKPSDFAMMNRAGFRMVLWGLESVNQATLDKLNKKVDIRVINQDLLCAKAAQLDSHLTVMFGYPWETMEDAERTSNMVKHWLKKGIVWSAQATICIPYPNTKLWRDSKANGDLLTEEWPDYDMTQPVLKCPISFEDLKKLQSGIYKVALSPEFIWRKIKSIRCWEDFKYMFRIARKVYDRFGDFYEVGKVEENGKKKN